MSSLNKAIAKAEAEYQKIRLYGHPKEKATLPPPKKSPPKGRKGR